MTERVIPARVRAAVVRSVCLFCLSFTSGLPAGANQLKGHPSPYLAMHGQDPVEWRLWGQEAIGEARRSGKPLFVSSGYFACYWCHVMQRESYHDAEVAELLNSRFVPVKVDRELLPALDAHLIEFVQRTRGSAGWPLNVFLTPEGYPLLGVTYLPGDDFKRLLAGLAERWQRDRGELEALAREAGQAPDEQAAAAPPTPDAKALMDGVLQQALATGDELEGGFGRGRRFPMASQMLGLLVLLERLPDERLRRLLVLTLDQIASQGLRDHLGGGFFRYTVDPGWRVPHFEKMLYTNALLAEVYLSAARVLGRPEYRAVAAETLDFLLAQMSGSEGGFIASLSAVDQDGIEGGYYLWRDEELSGLLTPDELHAARLRWGFGGAEQLEHGHHAVLALSVEQVAAQMETDQARVKQFLGDARGKLLQARASRRLPRDGKRLASWNGLVLSALARGARELGEPRYRAAAGRLRDYLVGSLWDGSRLSRARQDGRELGAAALEDYAYVARGLADWAESGGDSDDRQLAKTIARAGWRRFYRAEVWQPSGELLIPALAGEAALVDGPMPSPSAVLIAQSLRLAAGQQDQDLLKQARDALDRGAAAAAERPFWNITLVGGLARQGADQGK